MRETVREEYLRRLQRVQGEQLERKLKQDKGKE